MNKGLINGISIEARKRLQLDLKYFLSGGIWLTFSIIVSGIVSIILSSAFSRIWPQDAYGKYSFFNSAISFVTLTALPGMSQAIVQAISEGKEGFYKQAIGFVLKFSTIGIVFLLLGSIYFYSSNNFDLSLVIFLSSLTFPLASVGNLYSYFYLGRRDFKRIAIFSLISQVGSSLVTLIVLFKIGTFSFVALASFWSTTILNLVFLFYSLGAVKNNLTDKTLKSVGMAGSVGTIMFVGVDFLDKLFISYFLGFEMNAVYAFALIIPVQLGAFFKVFYNLAQPKVSELKNNASSRSALIKKSIQLEILIFFIVISYVVLAPNIFSILFPSYSGDAVLISQIFSLTLLLYPSNLFELFLVKKRAVKKGFFVSIIYSISSIVTMLIFLNFWGLIGAAFSKLVAKLIQVLLVQFLIKDEFNSK